MTASSFNHPQLWAHSCVYPTGQGGYMKKQVAAQKDSFYQFNFFFSHGTFQEKYSSDDDPSSAQAGIPVSQPAF